MRVLVVGSGGREHALCWRLAASPSVTEVIVAPGNGGTDAVARSVPGGDVAALVATAVAEAVDLVVVGPEAPLADGLVDALAAAGVPAFGPVKAAARLEASKAFAKEVMDAAGVPTARWARFDDVDAAIAWVRAADFRVVIKADGLAAGKGVVVCDDVGTAEVTLRDFLVGGAHGAAGASVVVEERLEGPEVSLLALVDGSRVVALPAAQDHKRVGDGDTGPNTGGMGAYAPAPIAAGQEAALAALTIQPIVDELARRGVPYRGVLYAGLMMTPAGPRVLEYNCRFGDPETQVLLPLIDGDLGVILRDCAAGCLGEVAIGARHAATVVAAAAGYPMAPRKGDTITGLDAAQAVPGVVVFHAGTARRGGDVVTAGGRVLTVTGVADTLRGAVAAAYAGLGFVRFPGLHARSDIAARALSAEEGA